MSPLSQTPPPANQRTLLTSLGPRPFDSRDELFDIASSLPSGFRNRDPGFKPSGQVPAKLQQALQPLEDIFTDVTSVDPSRYPVFTPRAALEQWPEVASRTHALLALGWSGHGHFEIARHHIAEAVRIAAANPIENSEQFALYAAHRVCREEARFSLAQRRYDRYERIMDELTDYRAKLLAFRGAGFRATEYPNARYVGEGQVGYGSSREAFGTDNTAQCVFVTFFNPETGGRAYVHLNRPGQAEEFDAVVAKLRGDNPQAIISSRLLGSMFGGNDSHSEAAARNAEAVLMKLAALEVVVESADLFSPDHPRACIVPEDEYILVEGLATKYSHNPLLFSAIQKAGAALPLLPGPDTSRDFPGVPPFALGSLMKLVLKPIDSKMLIEYCYRAFVDWKAPEEGLQGVYTIEMCLALRKAAEVAIRDLAHEQSLPVERLREIAQKHGLFVGENAQKFNRDLLSQLAV